jgi:dTDP-4-dehydrorhamnose reductase
MLKRIYISGCGGMLGEAFYRQFKTAYDLKCTDIDVNEDWLSYCDIRDFQAYRKDVFEFKPDYLFHLGAYTDLEFCENNVKETYQTNTMSVENAVYIANELNIPLLYIGTGGIFDGKKKTYDDFDVPNPMGVYARSKYMGERFVVENARRYLICRAGWMMGGGRKDKKFVHKILTQLGNDVKEIKAVADKEGTPTYTHDFALNVRLLLEAELWGVYNMACTGETSRLEVAKEIVSILNLNVKVTEVGSDYFKREYFAPRPPSEMLINRKLNIRGLNVMQDWKTALKQYLHER